MPSSLPVEDEVGTTRAPADVVLVMPEDDAGDTLRPRLEAAGADLSRVHIVQHVVMAGHAAWRVQGMAEPFAASEVTPPGHEAN